MKRHEASGRKPYERPSISSLSRDRLLTQLGPAQASVYTFDPLPSDPISAVGGGSGGTLNRR